MAKLEQGFIGLDDNSLIMQWNVDAYGNPVSIHINNEIQQVSSTHYIIQLAQIPDEYYGVKFIAELIRDYLIEVRNRNEVKNINQYYVDYQHGIVYFHQDLAGRLVRADYYGRGVVFLSDARIFHRNGEGFAVTLDEVLEKSEDAFKLIESTGGLNQAIELLDNKAEEGNKVADRLENFITETQFYGYTIVLSREAFVVRAKEDGNLHNGEMEDLTVDVIVYKGVKNLSAPNLDVRLYSTTNCECEIENQKLTITRIDVNCIQAQAIIEIDCGDGLIAYRTIEVTKVFDGVSQFNVEMTNAFHSFSATHSGKIEEEQSVTCEFTVTKANEEFKGYVVGIQNVPSGITHNLEKPTENASSVTFTAQPGISLPDNASISVVFQFNDYVITKTFAFTKSKQGLSAKSLRLTGNQIIHYENPNYEGTPNPVRTSIIAQVTDLSGTPVWSYLEDEEWIVINGQNGTNLNLYHNDRIWGTKHELTIKCELDGFSDEITLIKIANGADGVNGADGAMGLSSYSVILSNESTTLRVGLDGKIPTEELTSQYTRVTAFRGADQITPTSIIVPQGNNYEVSVSGSTINLIDVDTSASTVNIPIEILLDNTVVVNKVWSIAKTEKGEVGVAGAAYSINVEGGTRAITYNQLNENPRPTFSGVFTAHVYENGNDITSQIKSWYWTTQGHFTGTSTNSSFTPEIKNRFDESVLNNSVTVTAIYNHMPISYTVPIIVSKDLGGLDWVTDWDSTKVLIRDTEVLTPKLFAGEYNPNSDTINGVAIGTDVLNDGQVQGITGYQNNKISFLLATDGSLLIGNPFEDNGTGLSYNRGRFVLNVDEMAIAGGTVPTWDDMETQLEHHSKDIINAIQDNIDSMNETLNNMTTFVDTILQDELITTLEKVQLDALFQTVTQEVNNIQAQYDSVINNPYLADEDVRNLEKCHVDYMNAYSNIVDVYNDVFGEPVVEEVEYTAPQEEYLMTDDFILETVDVVDGDEVFDENMEEQPVMLADENVDLNPFMLDTLTTQDGYIIITKNGQPIQMVTENTLIDFSHAVDILREYSSILQQAISEALLSISENRASQMVEEAKEQVRAEIADVDSALNDLETTMNGSFKTGLIGEQTKAILNERLTQLSIEKKDVDGQYEVLSQNTVLSASNKETLGIAKDELNAAHDLLVSKINQVVIDNLITNTEIQAVNNLISEYANKLQVYSKVAQECNALIAQTYANAAVAAITDEDVFNKVTNYGVLQGLFLKDEKVYINSEYINTRNFKAVTDDGKETFKIDENGEVSITAKSLAITGSSNLATQDYVNTQIENLTNTNITFTLSNEFQIIPTDESYYPLSEGAYAIKVTGYKGSSEEITDFTIGTVTSNDAGIVPVVSNINKTIVLSVSPDAPLSDSNGYVDIPITYDNRQFNKRWSWAVSKQGNQATTVTITGEQFFKYSNNYTGTPTPSQIKVTANVFNSTETGKWQYDNNGTWVDCGVTDKVLTLLPTQYTLSSLRRVTLRYYVDSVFDTFTVACISDGANGTNGTNGTNGKGIKSIVNKYLATPLETGVTKSTSGWSDVVQQIDSTNKYLWNYEIITYTDNSTTETTPCVIGRYAVDGQNGQDGQNGEDGIGVSSIIEYYLISNSTSTPAHTNSNWSTTVKTPTKDAKYLWNYSEVVYTKGSSVKQTPRIIGNYAEDGQDGQPGASGSDAYTVLLTNENHTFVANHLGVTAEQIVTTDVIAYKGSTPITPTIGTLPSVTGLTLAKSGVRITIKANANVSTLADSGSFDIPITVDGKSFTKSFSWTKVKDGQAGASGANAKAINIVASNMVFKSTDGGTTFTPNDVKLTPVLQNLTYSSWQYSIDGGTTWVGFDNTITGWSVSSQVLTITKDCSLFTTTVTNVTFKCNATDSSFYDIITIVKLYDVADVDFERIAEEVAQDKVDELDEQLNQQNIFNRLTNNGETQGIYLEDEKLYINGEYIKSNSISADSIQTNTLIAPITEELNKENIFVIGMSHCHESYNYDVNVLDEKTVELKVRKYDKFSGRPLSSKRVSLGMGGFCPEKGVTYTMSGYIKINGQIPTSWIMSTNVVNSFNSTLSFIYDNTTGYFECTETRRILNGWIIYHSLKSEYNNTIIDDVITIEKLTYVEGTEALEWKPSDFETTFNKLTKDGYLKGLFFDNGKLYMNADYIETGTLKADLIQVRVDSDGNLMPFNYVTLDNTINTTNFSIMSADDMPYLNCQLPIFQGGASSDVMCTAIGYSDVEIEAGKDYYFMCEYYAVWGGDTKPDDKKGTSTATSGSKNGGLQNGQNMTLFLYNGDNVSQAKNNGYYQLATVYDFNSSVKIEERESYPGVYQRTWTTLTVRFTATESYKGKLCINLDCSGFFYNGGGGSFYLRRLQLTDATQSNPVFIDYTKQVKEKHIELTDGSYYTNIVGVDGMQIENGKITGNYPLSRRTFEIDDDGFKCRSTTGSENAFMGVNQSYYTYDGGSSGQITGYDDIYGFGCTEIVNGSREGVFVGVHHGFQKPNSTSYGRADIYTLYKDGYASDTHDWTLLGEKIEPLGLVRRDDYANITTQTCLCIAQSTGTGGTTYNGATVFSEAMYNAVGNGQLINVNPSDNRIYVGNPDSILLLESAYGLTVNEAGVQKQVVTNGVQYGHVQLNLYTGNNIEIWADSDKSSNEEYVWIGAGANAITIKSDYGALSPSSFKYNGNTVLHQGNIYKTRENAQTGREVDTDLTKICSYNLYNKALLNGDGTSSAYGGYWSVLQWGCGQAGSAQLAIDWTSQGKGFYMRSLRDTQDNWFKWKRIGNSDWILDSTSDERYKRAVSDVSTEDCYNMVKNIELHTYLLLTEEERYRIEKGELDADELFLQTVTSEGIHHSLQMGVLAQDMLKYSCGTYVVNQDVLRDENGELISDRYGIDAYNYASAILGGLQEEIKVRDEQYEELKKENEDLKARLEKLEKLILKGE